MFSSHFFFFFLGPSQDDDVLLVKKHCASFFLRVDRFRFDVLADYEPTLVGIHSATNDDIAFLWRRFVKNQKEHRMTKHEFEYMYMVMGMF